MLREYGCQAYAIKGGFFAWKTAGFPLEPKQQLASPEVAGPCPVCIDAG